MADWPGDEIAARGAGMPTHDRPPSRVRTTEVHGCCAHGAVPSAHPVDVDTKVADTGRNDAGTGPPAGPTAAEAGDEPFEPEVAGGVEPDDPIEVERVPAGVAGADDPELDDPEFDDPEFDEARDVRAGEDEAEHPAASRTPAVTAAPITIRTLLDVRKVSP